MSDFRQRAIESLRRFFGRRRLLPLTALLLRARAVRESGRFVSRELLRREGVALYRLRETGLQIAIRHCTGDVVTLGEVFHDGDYEPPPEVAPSLDGLYEIVDLGANIGLFSLFATARWPKARITAFEPDPGNVAIQRLASTANQLHGRWTIVPAAAGTRDGNVPFLAGRAALSRIAQPGEPDASDVPIRDVLPIIEGVDLLKMDIEGGEWAILQDPRFRECAPRVAVLEYHPDRCPTENPHLAVEAALQASGMHIRCTKRRDDGHGMLWAWRE